MKNARFLALFFFLSGFASLVYEVVWLRLSMSAFGVNAPVLSIVLSVFMAGLGAGSLLAGRAAAYLEARGPKFAIRVYAACELLVCLSVPFVPWALDLSRELLTRLQPAWASPAHYAVSGALIGLIMLPWTLLMGATLPLVMPALKRLFPEGSARSFSFLYTANLLGAAFGTLVSAFVLIELFGMRGTLYFAAAFNLAAASGALLLARYAGEGEAPAAETGPVTPAASFPPGLALWSLFALGAAGMGMEVAWMRMFIYYLGTTVYSFAAVLAVYLGANFLGAGYYRRLAAGGRALPGAGALLAGCVFCAAVSVAFGNPYLPLTATYPLRLLRTILGVAPFAAVSGFLVPLLVDGYCRGDAGKAAKAYAANVAGCILGPLMAGFLLLPFAEERGAVAAFALPLAALGFLSYRAAEGGKVSPRFWVAAALSAIMIGGGITAYERAYPGLAVRRDFEATTMAFTFYDGEKILAVNGCGMTSLTPITKFMAHMPMAMAADKPENTLIVAFGMGTTYRSALTWGGSVTAVDLVPSVPKLFWYFHPDAEKVLALPNGKVVIDDGRRFLARSPRTYDVITVDPPPPVQSPASGLLYSTNFYALAAKRLNKGGVLHQWVPPNGTPGMTAAAARSLLESFPHVRVFKGIFGEGVHFIATLEPLGDLKAAQLARRMPPAARADLEEWGPEKTALEQAKAFLAGEIDPLSLLETGPLTSRITDDRPFNEYYLLREAFPAAMARWNAGLAKPLY